MEIGGGEDGLKQFFSTVAFIVNKVQKDVWAVSHLYNQNNRFRIGTSLLALPTSTVLPCVCMV